MGNQSVYDVVRQFEQEVAKYSGAKYGVAVSSCTNAIFLSCLYKEISLVLIPKITYPGIVCSIIHAGGEVHFENKRWSGVYELQPYKIYDSALRFRSKMYKQGLYCLSFHIKKHLPIGRGGMILTDDFNAVEWLKRARYDGRRELPLQKDKFDMLGWNMYMTPEQAVRGLMLFDAIKNKKLKDLSTKEQGYPDLSKWKMGWGIYK